MIQIPPDILALSRELATNAVNGMCMTMDHSFGLQDGQQQRGLKLSMSQLAEHDVAPAIARAVLAERERCRKIAYQNCADLDEKALADAICSQIRTGGE